jgi:hypothetical protein
MSLEDRLIKLPLYPGDVLRRPGSQARGDGPSSASGSMMVIHSDPRVWRTLGATFQWCTLLTAEGVLVHQTIHEFKGVDFLARIE